MNKLRNVLHKAMCFAIGSSLILAYMSQTVYAGDKKRNVIRIGWSEDAYYNIDANGRKSGYGYEYQQEIAAYTGWDYECITGSFSELLEMLEKGEIDVMGAVGFTDEREDKILFSDKPMGEEQYFLYADLLATDISPTNLSTLTGKKVGVLESGVPRELLEEFEYKNRLQIEHVSISSNEDTYEKLQKNEIDGFISIESPTWPKEGYSPVVYVGGSDIYFGINKNCEDIKDEIDAAMRRIESDKPMFNENLYQRFLATKSIENLTSEEKEWIRSKGPVRVGYLKTESGVSLENEKGIPVGIINDYIKQAKACFANPSLKFKLVGFDSQSQQLEALKDGSIDMIFHVNQSAYDAEKNGVILSNTVFATNVAAITKSMNFDENKENKVAVAKDDILNKWYITENYPQWIIVEYDSQKEVIRAVDSVEADCYIVKAMQSAKKMEIKQKNSVFLTRQSYGTFAVRKDDTILLSILNKTLKSMTTSELSGAASMYDNAPGKVTFVDFIKDNSASVTIVALLIFVLILGAILELLRRTRLALAQTEAADRAKSAFLFNMSHDIRTPMNAILGYNKLMKKELTDPKLLDYQRKIETSGNLLLSIINNVLDMARIESGKVELDEDYIAIEDISDGIYQVFEEEARKKNIRFRIDVNVEHKHIICDSTKVREIYLNLISNAIKYTPEGGVVTVRINEEACDRQGYMKIKAEVIDNGIGMSEEFLPSLFEPFSREKNTTAGRVAGTGLGMPIIKRYIDMMEGSITVESKLGKGTKFVIIFYHAIADKSYYEKSNETISDSEINKAIKGKHILLAEDNDLNAEIAIAMLEDMGLVVDHVEDGVRCVGRIEQMPANSYDMILMDIQMPFMDGYKATQAIRRLSDRKKADIPIVAMTANAFEEDRKRALDMGMNAHLSKPIDTDKLQEVMISLFR